ncbi:MAG: hypothetical protein PHW19_07635 [Salinivirgaceae bacterium]|nr:hypothetical protein [Salinivirgaceae bacterium]
MFIFAGNGTSLVMAYNRENILRRIIDIQEITLQHTREHGSTQQWVYETKIFPLYRISIGTFYNYLATNAKAELRFLEKRKEEQRAINAAQLKIFDFD